MEVVCIGKCGRIIGDKYMLIEAIGKGGFGEVYLSVDVRLGKEWAVKRLLHQDADGLHEAAMLKELDYPTLPRVVDLVKEKDGVYLVMDYLRGRSLGDMLRQGQRFTQEETMEIGIRLAETLEYLHGKNPPILYRDMKPDNILLTDEGQIKLVDFGIACLDAGGIKIPGGTRGYAAPEQFDGRCDLTTDLYGLGRTLKILSKGKGSPGFRHIIRKCTRRLKQKRYQSADQVRVCLQQIYENKRQNQKLMGWVLGCLGILLAAGAVYTIATEANQQRYYSLLKDASQLEEQPQSLEQAVGLYKEACEICPEKEAAFLKFLDISLATEQTQKAVDWLNYAREYYPSETAEHKEVRERLALLYFCGNALDLKFNRDYEKAFQLFQHLADEYQEDAREGKGEQNVKEVPKGELNIWALAASLAESLGKFGSEIDWMEIKEALDLLKTFGERMFDQKNPEYAFELYMICGSIYLTDAAYLESESFNPYREGISCYEKADEVAEAAKLDPGLKLEVLERLASACYLTAVLETQSEVEETGNNIMTIREEDLDKSISYGNQLLQITASVDLRQRILLREASARKLQGKQEEARLCYEEYLQQYPEHVEGLCAYAEFLMENKEQEKARLILEQAALTPEVEKNRNYQILMERLEGLE